MIPLGARVEAGRTHFAVRAPLAHGIWLCLFEGDEEERHAMAREGEVWTVSLPGNLSGARYGYRAEGEWRPNHGRWFDPAKLLVDPYAVELDRRFVQDQRLATFGADTADIVPRAVVPAPVPPVPMQPPFFARGGLIYEMNVRAFTLLHPDVPKELRGTVAALGHPAVIAHLRKLCVTAVELMPVVAWIDERHLPPLGLVNAWGYNPVAMMALDPGLCPGGVAELRYTVAKLHAQGIGVLLDLVFNHSGESDAMGGVLSLRGLDDAMYAHATGGTLTNDTGCGNTLDFANPAVRRLTINAMRHFVSQCGVDGFRFDLATVLARGPGFDAEAPIFAEIAADPILSDRILIAEPWDIGPGGYRLGHFPDHWLEWNDRFRDDVRAFWRGDGSIGTLATRLAGSSDIFLPRERGCRSINFVAAHDGFTLADTLAFAQRHNLANGEDNRDGHGENFSWNNGIEGPASDRQVLDLRRAYSKAMLATLFASTGTIMLTAGDEFGRSQQGNNNAYCQDNPIGWVNWCDRDEEMEAYVAGLSERRMRNLSAYVRFSGSARWLTRDRREMTVADWEEDGADWLRCESGDPAWRFAFTVDRKARTVTIGSDD